MTAYLGSPHAYQLPDPTQVSMPADVYDLWEDFIESTDSLLDDLEDATLAYEQAPNEGKAAAAIRRILHKIKGESSMVGLYTVERICHEAESAFDIWAPADRPDMLLRVKDWIQAVLDHLNPTVA